MHLNLHLGFHLSLDTNEKFHNMKMMALFFVLLYRFYLAYEYKDFICDSFILDVHNIILEVICIKALSLNGQDHISKIILNSLNSDLKLE